jgi:hypothetical protein
MKKLILPASFALFALANSGCKEYKPINMSQVEQIYDSLKTIPGVFSMHVLQDDDYSKVTVILGDVALYNAGKDQVQQTASKVGMMVLHVLGPDNNISTGIFAVAKKDPDKEEIPQDAIKADMNINDLKKVAFSSK